MISWWFTGAVCGRLHSCGWGGSWLTQRQQESLTTSLIIHDAILGLSTWWWRAPKIWRRCKEATFYWLKKTKTKTWMSLIQRIDKQASPLSERSIWPVLQHTTETQRSLPEVEGRRRAYFGSLSCQMGERFTCYPWTYNKVWEIRELGSQASFSSLPAHPIWNTVQHSVSSASTTIPKNQKQPYSFTKAGARSPSPIFNIPHSQHIPSSNSTFWLFWQCPRHAQVPGPEIKSVPHQWQHQVLNLTGHQGTPRYLFLNQIEWISNEE